MQIHDENLKHNGDWSYRNSTSEIILHHAEASHASVEDINRWHLERRLGRYRLQLLRPQGWHHLARSS